MALQNPGPEYSRKGDEVPDEVAEILNGRHSSQGRNKLVFDYGDGYKLKLVVGDAQTENIGRMENVRGVADTQLITGSFEQKRGMLSKEGPVVQQEASDQHYAEALEDRGWQKVLEESVEMQETVVEDSLRENGEVSLCYDLRPANIHFFQDKDGIYEAKFIDVTDTQAISRPDSYDFAEELGATYEFLLDGKDGQKGLLEYAEERGVDVERSEAAESIAETSGFVDDEMFNYGEDYDLWRSFEMSINSVDMAAGENVF